MGIDTVWAECGDEQRKKIGSAAKLARLLDNAPLAINIEHYASILKNRKARRRIIECVNAISKRCHKNDCDLGAVEQFAQSIINETNIPAKGITSISLNEVYSEKIEEKPIIQDFLYEQDQTVMYAPGGVGKSLIVQDLAMTMGCGLKTLWGIFNIPKPRVSLFVQSLLILNSV